MNQSTSFPYKAKSLVAFKNIFMLINGYEELLDIFTPFVEAALHLILYIRELYPNELFEKRFLFGVPVYHCRHLLVSDYVKQIVNSVRPILISGALESISVLIYNSEDKCIEQFVLTFAWLTEIKPPADIKLKREELEGILRSFLSKVTVADALLQPITQGSPFEIMINLAKDLEDEYVKTLINEECPWISHEKPDFANSTLSPLKDLSTSLFCLKLFVEKKD